MWRYLGFLERDFCKIIKTGYFHIKSKLTFDPKNDPWGSKFCKNDIIFEFIASIYISSANFIQIGRHQFLTIFPTLLKLTFDPHFGHAHVEILKNWPHNRISRIKIHFWSKFHVNQKKKLIGGTNFVTIHWDLIDTSESNSIHITSKMTSRMILFRSKRCDGKSSWIGFDKVVACACNGATHMNPRMTNKITPGK